MPIATNALLTTQCRSWWSWTPGLLAVVGPLISANPNRSHLARSTITEREGNRRLGSAGCLPNVAADRERARYISDKFYGSRSSASIPSAACLKICCIFRDRARQLLLQMKLPCSSCKTNPLLNSRQLLLPCMQMLLFSGRRLKN